MRIIPEKERIKLSYPNLKTHKKSKKFIFTTLSIGLLLSSSSFITSCSKKSESIEKIERTENIKGDIAPAGYYKNEHKNSSNLNQNNSESDNKKDSNSDKTEKVEKIELPKDKNIKKTHILMGDIAPTYPEK